MSNTIENRILEMQFDNKQFEQGVAQTIKTLERLEKSLQLEDASDGFNKVATAAHSIQLGGLSRELEQVTNKFTLFGNIGLQVLTRLSNYIVDTGVKIGKSLSIDGVLDGYREFEQKMNSVQTILSGIRNSYMSEGVGREQAEASAIRDITAALEELNVYADRTIYSFSDMTANIGKFTNQGIDLKTSVAAIKGISNLAASAGADTAQASRAMYNISQSLPTGYMRLIDWRSITNANMATKEFRDLLIDVAKVQGELSASGEAQVGNQVINANTQFEDSLKAGWMTTDVLMMALNMYSKAYSAEELRGMGFLDEQIARILDIGEAAEEAATTVRTFSQLIDVIKEAVGSSWAQTFDTLLGGFEGSKAIFTEISEMLTGENGILTVINDRRNAMVEQFMLPDLYGNTGMDYILGIVDKAINLFGLLTMVVENVNDAIFAPLGGASALQNFFAGINDGFADIMAFLTGTTEGRGYTYNSPLYYIQQVLQAIGAAVSVAWTAISEFFGFVWDIATILFQPLTSGMHIFGEAGQTVYDVLMSFVTSGAIQQFFADLYDKIAPVVSILASFVSVGLEFVASLFSANDVLDENGVVIRKEYGFIRKLAGVLKSLPGIFGAIGTGFADYISNIVSWFDGSHVPKEGEKKPWIVTAVENIQSWWSGATGIFKKIQRGFMFANNTLVKSSLSPYEAFKRRFRAFVVGAFGADTLATVDQWIADVEGTFSTISTWYETTLKPIIEPIGAAISGFFTSVVDGATRFANADVTKAKNNPIEAFKIRLVEFLSAFNGGDVADATKTVESIFGIFDKITEWWNKVVSWYNETVKPFLDPIISGVQGFFTNLFSGVNAFYSTKSTGDTRMPGVVAKNTTTLRDRITAFFTAFDDGNAGAGKKTVDNFFNFIDEIKERWASVSEWFTQNVSPILNPISERVQTFFSNVVNGFSKWNLVTPEADATDEEKLKAHLTGFLTAFTGDNLDDAKNLADGFFQFWDRIETFYNDHIKPILEDLKQAGKLFVDGILGFFTADVPSVDENGNPIGLLDQLVARFSSFSGFGSFVGGKFEGLVGVLLGDSGLGGLLSGLTQVNESATEEAAQTAAEETTGGGWFSSLAGVLQGLGKNAMGGLENLLVASASAEEIDATVTDIQTTGETLVTNVSNDLTAAAETSSETDAAVKGVVTKKTEKTGLFLDSLGEGMGNFFDGLFKSPFLKVLAVGGSAMAVNKLIQGVTGNKTGLLDSIVDLVGVLKDILDSVFKLVLLSAIVPPDKIKAVFDVIIDFIKQIALTVGILVVGGAGVSTGVGVLNKTVMGSDNSKIEPENVAKVANTAATLISGIGTGLKDLMTAVALMMGLDFIGGEEDILNDAGEVIGKRRRIEGALEKMKDLLTLFIWPVIIGLGTQLLDRWVVKPDAHVENTIQAANNPNLANQSIGNTTINMSSTIEGVAKLIQAVGESINRILSATAILELLEMANPDDLASIKYILGEAGLAVAAVVGEARGITGVLTKAFTNSDSANRLSNDQLNKIQGFIITNLVTSAVAIAIIFAAIAGFTKLFLDGINIDPAFMSSFGTMFSVVSGVITAASTVLTLLLPSIMGKLGNNMGQATKGVFIGIGAFATIILVALLSLWGILKLFSDYSDDIANGAASLGSGLSALHVSISAISADEFAEDFNILGQLFTTVGQVAAIGGENIDNFGKLGESLASVSSGLAMAHTLIPDEGGIGQLTGSFEAATPLMAVLGEQARTKIDHKSLIDNYSDLTGVTAQMVLSSNNLSQVDASYFSGMTQYVEPIQGFLTGMAGLTDTDSAYNASSTLANTAAELLIFSGNIERFSNPEEGTADSISATDSLVDPIQALVTRLAGITGLAEIASAFAGASGALKLFGDNANGLEYTVDETTGRLKGVDSKLLNAYLVTLADALPTDEQLGEIASFGQSGEGGANLNNFAIGLTNLGTALGHYQEALSAFKPGEFTASTDFLKVVQDIANLPTDYSSIASVGESLKDQGLIIKRSPLDWFNEGIINLGTAVGKYGEAIKDIDPVKFTASTTFLTAVGDLATKLPTDYSKMTTLDGTYTSKFNLFSGDIVALGGAIKSFQDSLQNYDEKKFSAAVGNVESLVNIARQLDAPFQDADGETVMSSITGIIDWVRPYAGREEILGDNYNGLQGLAIGFTSLAGTLAEISNIVTAEGYSEEGVKNGIGQMQSLITMYRDLVAPFLDGYGKVIKDEKGIAWGLLWSESKAMSGDGSALSQFGQSIANLGSYWLGFVKSIMGVPQSSETLPTELPAYMTDDHMAFIGQVIGYVNSMAAAQTELAKAAAIAGDWGKYPSLWRIFSGSTETGMEKVGTTLGEQLKQFLITLSSDEINYTRANEAMGVLERLFTTATNTASEDPLVATGKTAAERYLQGVLMLLNSVSGGEDEEGYKAQIQSRIQGIFGEAPIPVKITPVLDTTNATTADGAFLDSSLGLNLTNATVRASIENWPTTPLTVRMHDYDRSVLTSSMASIRSSIQEMSNRLDNIEVRLDSGALVGQLVGPMNRELGKRVPPRNGANFISTP